MRNEIIPTSFAERFHCGSLSGAPMRPVGKGSSPANEVRRASSVVARHVPTGQSDKTKKRRSDRCEAVSALNALRADVAWPA